MGCSRAAAAAVSDIGLPDLVVSRIRQHVASDDAHSTCAPVATPRQHRRASARLLHDGLQGWLHVRVRAQYSIRGLLPGTLMRHDFLPCALAIDLGPPGMGEAPCAAALVAPAGLTHRLLPRPRAALPAAVALPSIARSAHPHRHAAARARELACALCLGRRLRSGHRPLQLEPANAQAPRCTAPLDTTRQPVPYLTRTRGNHGGARRQE
jgi:hypothetical protein